MKNVKKKIWYGVLLILLVFALVHLDLRGLWGSITQIPLWILAVLIALQIVSQLLVNTQWFQVARFSDARISFREMFLINCQGAVVDSITPGVKVGGEVTRAVQISRKGDCSGRQAAAVVAVQKLFSLSAFFFISLFALGFIFSDSSMVQTSSLHFVVYGFLICFLLLLIFIFVFPHRILEYLERRNNVPRRAVFEKLRGFIFNMLQGLIYFRKNSKAWIFQIVLSFFIWILYPVKMYLLTLHIYNDASLVFFGAVTFASYLVAMIPIFPGGLGGFEATMAGLLIAGGFTQSSAVAIAVVFRFFTFWFVMLFSLCFIGVHKLRRTRSMRLHIDEGECSAKCETE